MNLRVLGVLLSIQAVYGHKPGDTLPGPQEKEEALRNLPEPQGEPLPRTEGSENPVIMIEDSDEESKSPDRAPRASVEKKRRRSSSQPSGRKDLAQRHREKVLEGVPLPLTSDEYMKSMAQNVGVLNARMRAAENKIFQGEEHFNGNDFRLSFLEGSDVKLKHKCRDLEQRCNSLAEDNANLKRENEETGQKCKSLGKGYAKLKQRCDSLEESNASLKKENEEMRQSHRGLKEDYAKLKQQHEELRVKFALFEEVAPLLKAYFSGQGKVNDEAALQADLQAHSPQKKVNPKALDDEES